jgi:hypothetical protein
MDHAPKPKLHLDFFYKNASTSFTSKSIAKQFQNLTFCCPSPIEYPNPMWFEVLNAIPKALFFLQT